MSDYLYIRVFDRGGDPISLFVLYINFQLYSDGISNRVVVINEAFY